MQNIYFRPENKDQFVCLGPNGTLLVNPNCGNVGIYTALYTAYIVFMYHIMHFLKPI